jgi:carbonic anhydrase
MLDKTPEGDLFMVRNIGNQIATSKGSVQYGVNHLASSLLLIIGHSKCGAIGAAAASEVDKAKLEAPIQSELSTIGKVTGDIEGVKLNVNNQVAAADAEFADKIKEGHLVVIGAVYDFADDMKMGAGKLNIINVNGETDASKIAAALSAKPAKSKHKVH